MWKFQEDSRPPHQWRLSGFCSSGRQVCEGQCWLSCSVCCCRSSLVSDVWALGVIKLGTHKEGSQWAHASFCWAAQILVQMFSICVLACQQYRTIWSLLATPTVDTHRTQCSTVLHISLLASSQRSGCTWINQEEAYSSASTPIYDDLTPPS